MSGERNDHVSERRARGEKEKNKFKQEKKVVFHSVVAPRTHVLDLRKSSLLFTLHQVGNIKESWNSVNTRSAPMPINIFLRPGNFRMISHSRQCGNTLLKIISKTRETLSMIPILSFILTFRRFTPLFIREAYAFDRQDVTISQLFYDNAMQDTALSIISLNFSAWFNAFFLHIVQSKEERIT